MQRREISGALKKDSYMTTYLIPDRLLKEMATAHSAKGRTRWVINAIKVFSEVEDADRNSMLLVDLRMKSSKGMKGLPLRITKEAQITLRRILVSFRGTYPEYDLDISGIVRMAIIFHLRNHEGRDLL